MQEGREGGREGGKEERREEAGTSDRSYRLLNACGWRATARV
jgi:hypothetical protein